MTGAMSAFGTKRTSWSAQLMSAFGVKRTSCSMDVIPLMTQRTSKSQFCCNAQTSLLCDVGPRSDP